LTPYFQDGGHEVICAEKCCYLVSAYAAFSRRLFNSFHQFLIVSTVLHVFVLSKEDVQTEKFIEKF